VELYPHSSTTPSWRSAQLKDRDNFNFTSIIKSAKLFSDLWLPSLESVVPQLRQTSGLKSCLDRMSLNDSEPTTHVI
jgi:hypothetical protein